MFKRSANSERMRVRGVPAALLALALVTPGLAFAAPAEPLLMGPTYEERAPVVRVAGCELAVAGLADNRRAPETIGMVPGIRSIAAPADRDAWLRSAIETGLRARGFTPTFVPAPAEMPEPQAAAAEALATETATADPVALEAVAAETFAAQPVGPEAAPGPAVLTIRVRLQSVWLEALGMNKTGSVVLHMSAAHGAQSHEDYYRGEFVSPNWASGRGEFNEHLDRTFAEALNAMANDLVPMCGGSS